jgi:hypothetical protein
MIVTVDELTFAIQEQKSMSMNAILSPAFVLESCFTPMTVAKCDLSTVGIHVRLPQST